MAGDSEYAQRQFRANKAARAKCDEVDQELRLLRHKVQMLEQQVANLTTELAQRRLIGDLKRGYS